MCHLERQGELNFVQERDNLGCSDNEVERSQSYKNCSITISLEISPFRSATVEMTNV